MYSVKDTEGCDEVLEPERGSKETFVSGGIVPAMVYGSETC